jgi:HAD superfamily hydrolase (TIGR01509 family)
VNALARAGLIVLDLDGTLMRLDIDWPPLRAELRGIATRHDLELESERALDMLREVREAGAQEALDEMERAARSTELDAVERAPANAALIELLEGLDPSPPLAVLSLQSTAAVRRAVELLGWSDRVAHALGRDDVTKAKPDPDGLEALAALHAVDPSQVVLVGDSDTDHDAARAAGAASVDVTALGVDWRPLRA